MPRLTIAARRALQRDISLQTFSFEYLAKKHGVTIATVESYNAQFLINGKVKSYDNTNVVCFGTKTEAYHESESEMLSSPFYNATNRHLITPINPDWKLF